jgi:A/G-specific adenine glycosylase
MFKKLIKWSLDQNQHLPWRQDRDLYSTLVSEIMLQQTTVQTVLSHYERFLKTYPDIKSLAQATEEELTIQWKGLGYYRRARNLRSACIEIVEKFNGEIPLDYNKLINIKGIGDYTASALLSIGANKKELAIDANLERVLSRIYAIDAVKGPKLIKAIKEKFNSQKICQEINEFGGRDFNEALMDLGRVYCKANKVYCELCPMQDSCKAYADKKTLNYPLVLNKKDKQNFTTLKLLRVIVEKDNKFLTYTKTKDEWLALQNELPTFLLEDVFGFKQYSRLNYKIDFELLPMIKTGITKYKIENFLIIMSEKEFELLDKQKKYQYRTFSDQANLSTASIKALEFFDFKKQERR